MKKRKPRTLRIEQLEWKVLLDGNSYSFPDSRGEVAAEIPALLAPQYTQTAEEACLAGAPQYQANSASSRLDVKYWASSVPVGSNWRVRVFNAAGMQVLSRLTDHESEVQFQQLPAGSYRVRADFTDAHGRKFHGHFDFTGRFSRSLWVQEVVGGVSNLPVNGVNAITVHVENKQGRDVAGAKVRLLDANQRVVETYLTNAQGQVSFWNLGEQRYYVQTFDLATQRWVTPLGSAFKDFSTTGSRGWTPRVVVGSPTAVNTFVVAGQRSKDLGILTHDKDGNPLRDRAGTGPDYRRDGNTNRLNLAGRTYVNSAANHTDARLMNDLKRALEPAGSLATNVVARLFGSWNSLTNAQLAQSAHAHISKETRMLGYSTATRVLRHEAGSELSLALDGQQKFRDYRREIEREFKRQLDAQATLGRVDMNKVKLKLQPPPALGIVLKADGSWTAEGVRNWLNSPSSLFRIIGGFQGAAVQVGNFTLARPTGPLATDSVVPYTAELVVTLSDDFGLDSSDINHALLGYPLSPTGADGLRAQWILQHLRNARPFVNEVVVRIHINGTLKLPYGYNRLNDRLV